MDKNQEFYKNKNNYGEICVPMREKILNYLIKDKFLSEFSTEEEKLQVLENLGITQKIELLKQLINIKADITSLSRYITKEELTRRLSNLTPKNEKSKGYFSSFEELNRNYPVASENDWAIVNVDDTWFIYKFSQGTWEPSGTFDMTIDLSEYAKLVDLEALQPLLTSGVNIKTINGQSILGEGNIEIKQQEQEIDLSNYVTKEYLYNIQNPLKATMYVSPALIEYTGEFLPVNISCVTKKGNTTVVPDSIELKYKGLTENINGTYVAEIQEKGVTTFTATCVYGEETVTCSGSVTLTLPTYIGFSSAAASYELNLSNLSKKIVSGISMTQSLQNTVAGNYLWIVSPYRVNSVATDPGFTYKVAMLAADNVNGLYYYRSSSALDVSHLTYYIK